MELLAPAGTIKAAMAAVQSGADAVYAGGGFSARRAAENFDMETLKETVAYCHLRGAAVHAAANILIKEREAEAFLDYIGQLNAIGVDAVIIQDLGMAKEVRRRFPDLPLHASTQMTVTSLEGVRYLEALGFSRVVLARELDRHEIEYIKKHAAAEIEVFCHGAICACYSGQCLMSSVIGGRSGNRGMCAQPCRLPYEFLENGKAVEQGYVLSPKDMALIEDLRVLKEIGVDSLKIEGRLKRPEYVAAVTGLYRKYIDRDLSVSAADMQELLHAFNRSGFTDFYFQGQSGRGMMSYGQPGNSAENTFTAEVKARCADGANFRKVPISIKAELRMGQPLRLTLRDGQGNMAFASGGVPAEQAEHKPLDAARLKEQLEKLGQTVFVSRGTEIELDAGVTIPISDINQTRRDAAAALEAMRTATSERRVEECARLVLKQRPCEPELSVQIMTEEQLQAAVALGIRRIYAPVRFVQRYETAVPELVAVLPPVDRGERAGGFKRVLVSNLGQITAYRDCILYGDFRLNIMNSSTCAALEGFELVTLSPELQLRELCAVQAAAKKECIVYGRLPLMILGNCPIKALTGKCRQHEQRYSLRDRMHETFPLLCSGGCFPGVYNSKPLFMADRLEELKRAGISGFRLVFTVEPAAECTRVIREYQEAFCGKPVLPPPENTFTRGHFYRGVQ